VVDGAVRPTVIYSDGKGGRKKGTTGGAGTVEIELQGLILRDAKTTCSWSSIEARVNDLF